jgi:ABC-2 type transport system permease protein
MSTIAKHSAYLTGRSVRVLRREPIYAAFTLASPLVWLLLFTQLFERVVDVPGFGDVAYNDYITPGIVIMTAMMNAGWAGTSFIDDMSRGVMDRNLTSPLSRTALIVGNLSYNAIITVVQSAVILGVAFLMGARPDNGPGVLVLLASAILVCLIFAAFSCTMALLLGTQESLIGIFQFVAMPLLFLSTVLISREIMPGWLADVALFNPVDWGVVAGREALMADPDWGIVLGRGALLLGLTMVLSWLATRAFRAYQRRI